MDDDKTPESPHLKRRSRDLKVPEGEFIEVTILDKAGGKDRLHVNVIFDSESIRDVLIRRRSGLCD